MIHESMEKPMSTPVSPETDLRMIDLFDPALFCDGPPHELFARLRREAPVHWNPRPDGDGVWVVMRHADITAISRDTETFSSYRGGIMLRPNQVMPLEVMRHTMLVMDPPEHTKYRGILKTIFTPRTVRHLEPAIRARVTRVLDEVIERGECDFVEDIAKPIPLGVLTELMGVPDSDIPKFEQWTNGIEEAQRAAEDAAGMDTFGAMAAYLHEQIQLQAQAVGEGLVKRLQAAEVDGRSLDDAEILTFFAVLVFGGNDTTRNTASTGLLALFDHPEALQELKHHPDLIPQAVEEILRFTSVVNWFARTATRDTELGGQSIKEGDRLVMWYASASRDEAVFDDPHALDIHRPKPDHKAFGGGGRHFCLGNAVARLELKVIFEEVLRRMPDIELAGPPVRVPSTWTHSLTRLPVRFTPGDRESER